MELNKLIIRVLIFMQYDVYVVNEWYIYDWNLKFKITNNLIYVQI